MDIRKRILALLLVAGSLLGLTACGSVQAEAPEATQALVSQSQTLAAAGSTVPSLPFTDIPTDADYAQAVEWCYEKGLMQGTSATEFSPNATLTRAMVATILYRAAGEPSVTAAPNFTDTQAGAWYSNAVTWANGRGIVHGYGGGLFGPNDPVTRRQLNVMIARYNETDSTWTGDPALSVPATRAEAAVAFYTHLNKTGSSAQGGKALVVYFSRTGENYGVGTIEKGNTHIVADMIAEQMGAETFELVPAVAYPEVYEECTEQAQREKNENARPALASDLDSLDGYDVIFLGYPIWWSDMPMPVYTFLEAHDWNGKTVVPFCTHAGSGLSGTVSNIKTACAGATVLDGLAVAGTTAQNDQETARKAVTDWLTGLDLPLQSSEDGKSVVYMTTDISPEGLMAVYEALNWTPTGNVAVKLSTGEPPASNYLRPELIKDVVQAVDGTIVECNTAYGGSRASTAMHYQVARDHGFNDIADVVILDENGSMTLPVTGGTVLSENYVGEHFADYDSYLVLSHFKGHSMAGFGGAIKNISIGLGSSEGKCWIHSGGTSRTNAWGGEQTAFTESMAEAGKSVSDYLDDGNRIVYINVMNRLSVDCDCNGNPAEPDMHDIGILASTDPVALDQACVDLVYAQKDGDGASLVRRIESRNGLHTLEHAEEIGLGNREYQLVSIDG